MPSRTELQGCSWANLLFLISKWIKKAEVALIFLTLSWLFRKFPIPPHTQRQRIWAPVLEQHLDLARSLSLPLGSLSCWLRLHRMDCYYEENCSSKRECSLSARSKEQESKGTRTGPKMDISAESLTIRFGS